MTLVKITHTSKGRSHTKNAPEVLAPATGTKVLCAYRLPSLHQHWIHVPHIGVVREPGDSVEAWNGYNTERVFCATTNRLPIEYAWGVRHDDVRSLTVVTEEDEAIVARWFDETLSMEERAAFLARHERKAHNNSRSTVKE